MATPPAEGADTGSRGFRMLQGRFEASFADAEAAKAAARDARSSGFVVDIRNEPQRTWLLVGRRRGPFPADEESRYASRLSAIASLYEGSYTRFVEEP